MTTPTCAFTLSNAQHHRAAFLDTTAPLEAHDPIGTEGGRPSDPHGVLIGGAVTGTSVPPDDTGRCPACHSCGTIVVHDPLTHEHWGRCFKCLNLWEVRP